MDSLAGNELEIVRTELEQATAQFRATDGAYTFPMACRLFWAPSKTPAHSSAARLGLTGKIRRFGARLSSALLPSATLGTT
jgi:hypothetical protein